MTSLSDGEVRQSDVMRWAQEQAKHLSPPSLHHVLLYLCLNAFYTDSNPESRAAGSVLTGRSRLAAIQMGTGLSRATVKRALRGLQDTGYILCDQTGGDGPSDIGVCWFESADVMREEVRAGVRELPKAFTYNRNQKTESTPRKHADVIPFPARGGSD